MKTVDTDSKMTAADREIARKFAQMRSSEAASAPAFSQQIKPATERAKPETMRTVTRILPRLAAAVALVAVAIALLNETPQEDPAALYAGIMESQQVQTDSLLHVSDSVLPALGDVPMLFDMESAMATEVEIH